MSKSNHYHFSYRCLVVVLSFVSMMYGHIAQAQNADSLETILKRHQLSDTAYINILVQLAEAYSDGKPDSAIAVGKRGLALADGAHFRKGKAGCLSAIGRAYVEKRDYPRAIPYFKDALEIDEKEGHLKEQAADLYYLGNLNYRQINYTDAVSYLKKSAAISEKINEKEQLAKAYMTMGSVYNDQASYPDAINYYLKALKLYEQSGNRLRISITLTNIATVYAYIHDTKNALNYVEQSKTIKNIVGKPTDIINNLTNIGTVYGNLNKTQDALASFNRAYAIADSIGNDYWKNILRTNLGQTNFDLGKWNDAMADYEGIIKDSSVISDPFVVKVAFLGKGNILLQQKKYTEGIRYSLIAYDYFKKTGSKDIVYQLAHELTEGYEAIHDYKKALEFHKIYFDYKDSVGSDSSKQAMQQLQFDYQLAKKQSQIEILNKNKLIQRGKNEKQRIILWSLAGGVILLIMITGLLIRSRRLGIENNKRLSRQKDEIRQQANRLSELNNFKDKTFSVLSHDLRGPLVAFTAALDMLDSGTLDEGEYEEMKPEIKKQLNSLSILLENLLQWSKSHMQGQAATYPSQISLQQLTQKNVLLVSGMAQAKQISIQDNVAPTITAWADEEEIDIIIRNLLTNAVKFTPGGGSVTISSVSNEETVQLSIADTGVGMTGEQLEKVFMATADNHTYGTNGEKGIGLGLLLCYEFIRLNKGNIVVQSAVNKGTVFTITLPVNK